MKLAVQHSFSVLAVVFSMATTITAQTSDPLPSADEVVGKMMQLDAQRQAELTGYTAMRRYVAVNKTRRAEMLVRVTCDGSGAKQFSILSEAGSGSIRKHVFQRLLIEETEASRRGARNSNRLTPSNYAFKIVGRETLDTGPAYALDVSPKTPNKYLIDGKIWIDGEDYSIVRIEGQPARNPSFWVRSVHFVHTYQKVGQFWLACSTRTKSEIRIFGNAELIIENSNYALNLPIDGATEGDSQARFNR